MKSRLSPGLKSYVQVFILLSSLARTWGARPGDLDVDFTPPPIDGPINTVAVQSDGRVLIGGQFSKVANTARRGFARLHSNGTFDSEFANSAELSGTNVTINSILLRADGRILIGGSFDSIEGRKQSGLAQLKADGTLDESFKVGVGTDGPVSAMALYSSGELVIAGNFRQFNGQISDSVARVNVDGSSNFRFGDSFIGPQASLLDPQFPPRFYAVVPHTNMQFFVGGSFRVTHAAIVVKSSLVRITTNGYEDSLYSASLYVDTLPGAGKAFSLAWQDDGKLLVGGIFNHIGGADRLCLARLKESGQADTSFDAYPNDNSSTFPFATWPTFRSITPQFDGRIIVAGLFSRIGNTTITNIARLNTDGSVDLTFAPGLSANGEITWVGEQLDGRLLIAGRFNAVSGAARPGIARLHGTPHPPGALQVRRLSGRVQIQWPVSDLVLQELLSLSPGEQWTPGPLPDRVGQYYRIDVPASRTQRFFRLALPSAMP